MLDISKQVEKAKEKKHPSPRKSSEALMPPAIKPYPHQKNAYDIYPYASIAKGRINNGYDSLAEWIAAYPCAMIDGFSGVLWDEVQAGLEKAFSTNNTKVRFIRTQDFFKPESAIQELAAPFLGDRDSVWGTKTDLQLEDFFEREQLLALSREDDVDCTILIGPGAALVNWDAPVIYLDVPKNEIQYRMRAGAATNLGIRQTDEPAHMYKQCYFIDWVVLNRHRRQIADRIAIQGDVQWTDTINWIFVKDLLHALKSLTGKAIRVRPWFEPGAWGGQWMKERIDGLNKAAVNYAWSFELIVPENGLVFESDGWLLEVPFDLLMTEAHEQVLGKHAGFFGHEFPIRFDFLDTWEGGNLSIQCHPSVKYIRQQFGEHITQDETYYILDCKPGAKVYLGFREGVDADEFRERLEKSKQHGEAIDVEKYVQVHDSEKHGLYLIPNGTIHSAGADNLVLEISSTPYIFTFKMYDWLRLDLNGEPRAINIEHAYNNLRFEFQGEKVKSELVSKPALLESTDEGERWHLPTHADHFYDVHRLEFEQEMSVETNGSCHVLMLVEGESILVRIGNAIQRFHFAETFVIPAAVAQYSVINEGRGKVKLVKAFIKDSIDHFKAL